jgi:hypothetical protein
MEGYKFNEKTREDFLSLLRCGNSRKSALDAVGITRHTLRNHMLADSDFAKAVEDAETDAVDMVEDALFDKCSRGNVTAIIFFLANRRPDRWQNVSSIKRDKGQNPEELQRKFESIVDFAVRRLPQEERGRFIEDLRQFAGLGDGSEEGIPESTSDPADVR